jgi:hypothetical protein
MLTLDDKANQFEFVCPIFNVQTKMRLCMTLRELFWMGKKPDVRKGCQACMRSSKCPAAAIVNKISYSSQRPAPDEYGSTQPVVGKLRKDILERILLPIVLERTMDEFGVPEPERQMIRTSSDRIAKMVGAAPIDGEDRPATRAAPAKKTKSTVNRAAAASGDLAAAVNA